ncbi:MAG TPA: CHAP domain-containing protein [Candidatus Saccharimonadales bacterium]|nr:CHAP domain-containing protein [Candidatus Saccharimonadales bacterium]
MVRKKFLIFTVLIGSLMAGATFIGGAVKADQFDSQIQALENQNAANQAASDSLAATASSYQQAIDALASQINSLQQNIVNTQSQIDALDGQIKQAQAELDQEKQVLGENIKAMYLEGDISTLEILASSKNLSDYVNKQEYRNSVSDKVKASVDKVNSLKAQLQKQQDEQKGLLANLQKQQSQLQDQQNQQAQLLSYTEAQKSQYDQQISSNNSQIASLRAQQAALNRQLGGVPSAGDPGHGGYPAVWNNAAQDTLIDNWGMYNRECVSYTAWKVFQTYGYMPYWGGSGNANQWPADARAAGIPTGSVPKVHSVAIWNVGYFGHAMWVEAVSGNTIYVSQYNYDLAGHYSEMSINGSGLTYIYFGG